MHVKAWVFRRTICYLILAKVYPCLGIRDLENGEIVQSFVLPSPSLFQNLSVSV
jgi:hypothetical protein